MKDLIAACIRSELVKKVWLFDGERGFQGGFSYESQIISLCHELVDELDVG